VRTATVPPVRVDSTKLAEGVYYLAGGSHHSVAVEFRDFTAVVEAPQDERRVLAVIEAVYKLIPIAHSRVVNSHHHFDHPGGIRTIFREVRRSLPITAIDFYGEVLSPCRGRSV
jgi:glyoxylase-like metal-dependent hydrolase (beta-lactamase superfamily II)